MRIGHEIYNLLKDWEECPNPGKKRKALDLLCTAWKRKSIFWDMSYWPFLDTALCLELMHIMKNVCESLVATLLNMPKGKTTLDMDEC
jgi:hypothetical protein